MSTTMTIRDAGERRAESPEAGCFVIMLDMISAPR
jgi:hypothetical protein